jgi:hypothetical protein
MTYLTDALGHTNGLNFELYNILGETYGLGSPLAFLFIKVEKGAGAPNIKSQYIIAVLKHLVSKHQLKINTVHTDKDTTEINACCAALLNADHQLCFWHALKAVRQRLAVVRRSPALYNSQVAREVLEIFYMSFTLQVIFTCYLVF